ncbi:MAG TPA: DUF6356 family protein [Rhizomicrobium sp.]|jgi:hypothetical protein|nr:DUF6356 family protein [Rhizomicrobium sp.]
MVSIDEIFTEHPHSVGETYIEHMHSASYFGVRMMGAGLCCMLHGIFPFLFVRTGSQTVTQLHDKMVRNRMRPVAHDSSAEIGAHI